MLQPGMCSAISSESSTWIGPPGALATHSAISPSSGRRDVGAADAGVRALQEGGRQVGRASAGRGGRRRRCRRRSRRWRPRRPALRAFARPRFSVLIRRKPYSRGDLVGAVGRAVVDDDHLVVRVLERAQAVEAVAQRVLAVVGADDDRDARPGGVASGRAVSENALPTAASACLGWRSRSTRPKAQSSMSKPPRCHSSVHENTNMPGAAGGERGADLPVERPRLRLLGCCAASRGRSR